MNDNQYFNFHNKRTQEKMVDWVGPNNKFDGAKVVNGCFSLSRQRSRGEDPDIAGRKSDRGGATTNSEQP